jgi:hypothetical protein
VDPHSKAEKVLAIAAMAPYFIMCALTTLIARCRELLVCSWLVGIYVLMIWYRNVYYAMYTV